MKKSLLKTGKKTVSIILVLLLALSIFPFSTFAAPASDIPKEMLENNTLDALEYTGFKLQALKDAGLIYKSGGYGSSINSSYLSGIGYGLSPSGRETVASAGTATGRAPDLARFRSNGMCCASYVSYYYLNYLPNIKGVDTTFLANAITATGTNSQSVSTWVAAGNALVSAGKAQKITATNQLKIGDVVVFENGSTYPHVALYAGTYGGRHFLTHVGNERGPEFSTIEGMGSAGDKSSYFAFAYRFPDITHFDSDGYIEVNKKDLEGRNLSGAVFTVYSGGTAIAVVGPTNASGYAKSRAIPYGTYTITETTFPDKYTADGPTSWTRTIDSSTPNATITINAINKLKDGHLAIIKTTQHHGGTVSGFTFEVRNSSNTLIGTYTSGASGKIDIPNLRPGVYSVKEINLSSLTLIN